MDEKEFDRACRQLAAMVGRRESEDEFDAQFQELFFKTVLDEEIDAVEKALRQKRMDTLQALHMEGLRRLMIEDYEREEKATGHSRRLEMLARYADDGPEPDEAMLKFYTK